MRIEDGDVAHFVDSSALEASWRLSNRNLYFHIELEGY